MKSSSRPVRAGLISARRVVPPEIARPPYVTAQGGDPLVPPDLPLVRSPDVIERMRRAGAAAARVLRTVGAEVGVGVTTDHLDEVAHEAYLREGGYPSTLGYRGYPKSLCTSVNEVVAHGIPDSRPLESGDIVNCDVTIYLDGVHGDCSATFLVGDVDEGSRHLVQTTRECLDVAIAAVRPGERLREIGLAIQDHAEANGYGVVRDLVGHGIGEHFHTPPNVPHYFDRRASTRMQPGMTFTIEPMLTMGDWACRMWDDGWTVVTADAQRSAQFEHTVLVTERGVDILTL